MVVSRLQHFEDPNIVSVCGGGGVLTFCVILCHYSTYPQHTADCDVQVIISYAGEGYSDC